jgi:hypothetical protein
MKTKLIISIAAILILIFSISILTNKKDYIEINNKKIFVEIADSQEERAQGLMFREKLCNDCGMLFIFEQEDIQSFWMKNTLIPLDIIFINKDLTILDIFSAQPCTKDPCQSYTSEQKALYVLETNKGTFNRSIIGEKIKLSLE